MSSYIKLRFGRLTFCLHLYSANKLNAKTSWNCSIEMHCKRQIKLFLFQSPWWWCKKKFRQSGIQNDGCRGKLRQPRLYHIVLRIPTAPRLVSRQLLDWTTSRYYLSWYSPALCNITSTPPNLIFHIVGCPICYKSCKNRNHLGTTYRLVLQSIQYQSVVFYGAVSNYLSSRKQAKWHN